MAQSRWARELHARLRDHHEHSVESIDSDKEPERPSIPITRLLDRIYQSYQLDIWKQEGVRSNEIAQHMSSSQPIPDFGQFVDVDLIGDTLTYSFVIGEELENITTLSSSKREMNASNKYKLRHEFVAEAISLENTDMKIGSSIEKLDDDNDILTPDFIIRDSFGNYHVIEVGTVRVENENQLERVFREKHFKYIHALRDRALNRIITYTPIIVGISSVCSNIVLPKSIVDDLLIRMKIALAIENVAIGKGFRLTSSEDDEILSELASELKHSIGIIGNKEMNIKDHVTISNEFIGSILEEPDLNVIEQAYAASRKQALKVMLKDINNQATPDNYIKKLSTFPESRSDRKPIILMPFHVPESTKDSTIIEPVIVGAYGQEVQMKKLWNSAFNQVKLNQSKWKEEDKPKLLQEALETDQSEIKKMEKMRKETRRDYHRVNLNSVLDNNMRRDLAKDGVYGKKWSKDAHQKSRVKFQKLPFSYQTDLKDIDDLIKNDWFFEKSDKPTPVQFLMAQKCNDFSQDNAGNSDTNSKTLKDWCGTNLFRWLEFISDVGIELAISIKQNTSPGQMILKKLRYWNCYVLISPTNSRSHIFVSMFFPGMKPRPEVNEMPGSKIYPCQKGGFTRFVSFRADKLENLISSSASMLALVSQWSDFYGLTTMSVEEFNKNSEAKKMMILCLMVRLEDKAETEESITLSRYMYMEVFKSGFSTIPPNPFKILGKFSSFPRSRLNLWFIKSIICNFQAMKLHPPERISMDHKFKLSEGEDSLPGDEWIGLLNCFTGSSLQNAAQCIELIYIGYFKNKNQTSQSNNDWKLVDKIIQEEITLDINETWKSRGEGSPDQIPGKKQFNKHCIMAGCKLLEKKLYNTHGENWKSNITNLILEELARKLTHEIATLKASSSIEHDRIRKTVNVKNNEEMHRIKVIEAVAVKLNDIGLNPMTRLEHFISYIEKTTNGVVCDIFSKNQHGGIREIYVLTIESRIVQLFIETISRVLCLQFEEETLTHPSNKVRLIDDHKAKSAKYSKRNGNVFADYCNSSDKTRWNQNFVMTAMSIPLFRLTEPLFHNSIQRIFNLWANKMVKIPPAVCSLLLSKTKLSSGTYMDLLEKFWNPRTPRATRNYIRDNCGSFLNLTTGMMQGILHYTSSLLHVAYLKISTSLTLQFLRAKQPKWKFTMTQICSSDDSATIISMFSPADIEKVQDSDLSVISEVELSLYTLSTFCAYFCMRESEKSTLCLYDYIEFNSEFIFKNTIIRPKIKLIAACTNLTESESYPQRFHTFYNLISDLYAAGMCSKYVSFVQVSQLWIHYKTMGLSSSGLFQQWLDLIIDVPLPMFGLFIVDSEMITGFLGWTFSYWLLMTTNPRARRLLMDMDKDELETGQDGSIIQSLSVKHGDSIKYHNLIDVIQSGRRVPFCSSMTRNKLTGDKEENKVRIRMRLKLFEDHKMILFRHPKTIPELRVKLMMKASMPGVSKSLGKGNPFIQAMSMSIYSIFSHCFTKCIMKSAVDPNGVNKRYKEVVKTSLLSEMTQKKEDKSRVADDEQMEKMMRLSFPIQDRYEEALDLIMAFEYAEPIKIHRIRQRKTVLVIQPKTIELPLTLMQTVTHKWFGFPIRTTERVFKKCWDSYRMVIPWLEDTLDETQRLSPYGSCMELYFFLSSQMVRPRKLIFTGPGIFSNVFSGQVYQLIRKHYQTGSVLEIDKEKFKHFDSNRDALSSLSLALMIPHGATRVNLVQHVLMNNFSSLPSVPNIKMMRMKDLAPTVMSAYLNDKINLDGVVNILNLTGRGTLISFTKAQNREVIGDKVKWTGRGEALVFIEGVTLKVTLFDDYVDSITTDNFDYLRRNPSILKELMDKLSSRPLRTSKFALRCSGRYSGGRIEHPTAPGTPITYDQNLEKIYLSPKNMEFRIRQGVCGFYSNVRGQLTSILEFPARTKDFSLTSNVTPGTDFWKSWINFIPVDASVALAFIKDTEQKFMSRRFKGKDSEGIKNWICSTLKYRLQYKSIGFVSQDLASTIVDSSPGEEYYALDPEEMEDFLVDFYSEEIGEEMMELIDTTKGVLTTTKIGLETQEIVHETDMDPELYEGDIEIIRANEFEENDFTRLFTNYNHIEMAHQRTVQRNRTFDYLHMHPLWDSFIDEVMRTDHLFFAKILNGTVPLSDSDLAKTVMFIMDIPVRAKELNITKRLEKSFSRSFYYNVEEEAGPSQLRKPADNIYETVYDSDDSD